MEAFIFSVVVMIAVVAVVRRKSRKQREYEAYKAEREEREGHAPDTAWIIHHPDDMDIYVRRERCHCGNKVWRRAEATPPDAPHTRVAVCECYYCEEVIRLYFEIEYLN